MALVSFNFQLLRVERLADYACLIRTVGSSDSVPSARSYFLVKVELETKKLLTVYSSSITFVYENDSTLLDG